MSGRHNRARIVDMWLGTITRAIARGDGQAAGILTRHYVQSCRTLGLLGPRATRADDGPLERPNDGELPHTLPVVTWRWDRRDVWEV